VASGFLTRVGVVTAACWRGSVAGYRGWGLLLVAACYPLLILGIASTHRSDLDLVAASEELFSVLFLPILLLLVCLVLGVSLFRAEIEEDTLVYPMVRSVPRLAIVLGKFLGFLAAALCLLLPSALAGPAAAVAFNAGPQLTLDGLLPTLLATTALGVLAYGAFFLLLGLVTRQALVIGLLYGFFWEAFLPLLPGPLKELSLVYYLRGIGARLMTSGPLTTSGSSAALSAAIVVPLVFALVVLLLSYVLLARTEIRSAPASA
jgi:ABC-2 type transport system permease protein